jgi:L-histidine N-alpha-methyltransferase
MNRELGANFDRKQFQHFGTYQPQRGAMESYLVSTEAQEVYVSDLEKPFRFKAYEPIHLEYSYKYLVSDVESMARDTGFEIVEHFFDDRKYFVDSVWRVKKH